ncbi:MAG: glycerate kinase [Frankiales bacterium]|nr:glycerate kinase [Frankiales bacterium]
MRVVIAPDCFAGTLSAQAAADALAEGWRRVRPHDELVLVPMSDGGPGFLDVLPGQEVSVLVEDPLARPTLAAFRLDGRTAYVESAQACGLHLLDPADRDPALTTSYGVGQLVRAAVDAGARQVVLGLGGSATNDGGAGMLAALGVRREGPDGEPLEPGCLPLAHAVRLVGTPLAVELVAATDVDNPLLGEHGATRVFGGQKGARDPEALEGALAHWADLLEAHLGVAVRDLPGAGAAGGLGFALLALGAERVSGVQVVAAAVGLADAVAGADLVVTGEGSFDWQSLRGKVVSGVAATAGGQAVPCVVVAGRTSVGRREAAAAGVDASYSLVEELGLERALSQPGESLATVASTVARAWGV